MRNVYGNYAFPLWVGKSWSYEGTAIAGGINPTKPRPIGATEVVCQVLNFKQITVTAGTFGAFQCRCRCELAVVSSHYDSNCGEWTFWYAPEVKNTIRRDHEESDRNWELVDWE